MRAHSPDRFKCPRCGTFADQEWLLPVAAARSVSWSICAQCHRISIWEGGVLTYPTPGHSMDATDGAEALAILLGLPPSAGRLLALKQAVDAYLAAGEAPARAGGCATDLVG